MVRPGCYFLAGDAPAEDLCFLAIGLSIAKGWLLVASNISVVPLAMASALYKIGINASF